MARHTGGWVKLWRKAALGDIGSNYTRGGLFSALISMANIQASKVSWRGKPIELDRGQIVTSMKELAELGEVDRSTVLRHLNYLVLRGTVSFEKSNKGILLKINNYEQYQGVDAGGPHQTPTQAQQRAHIHATHNEERKNKRTSGALKQEARFKFAKECDLVRPYLANLFAGSIPKDLDRALPEMIAAFDGDAQKVIAELEDLYQSPKIRDGTGVEGSKSAYVYMAVKKHFGLDSAS